MSMVGKNKSYRQDEKVLRRIRNDLEDALSCRLIPEQFHAGIHRILLLLLEFDDGIIFDEYVDIIGELEGIVNSPDHHPYDLDGVRGCVGLGTEFNIFSLHSVLNGKHFEIVINRNSIPFLMSIVEDYDAGLEAALMISKTEPTAFGVDSNVSSNALFGHWRDIARVVLAASMPDNGEPVSYDIALSRFMTLLASNVKLQAKFGSVEGFEHAIDKLSLIGLLESKSDKIHLNRKSAVMFLTCIDDQDLLQQLCGKT